MTYRINFFLIIHVLVVADIIYPMKKELQLANWDYKQIETSCLHDCCRFKGGKKIYPYFSSEKDDKTAQHSLRENLLFAERVFKKELKDIKNHILLYSYLIEQYRDQILTQKYTSTFYKNHASDLLYANQITKQTLLYVLQDGLKENNEIRVVGADKEFARKMSQNILNLPPHIKSKIIEKFGPEIMCNLNYEPSCRNILLDDEDNKNIVPIMGGCCAGLCCMCYVSKILCSYSITKTSIALASVILTRITGWDDVIIREHLFSDAPVALSGCCYGGIFFGINEIVNYFSKETQEQKDNRHGFELISLKEMECNIIDV